MLKKILSITGKPGLFKILTHSNRSLIVEDVTSKKRFPVSPRDKVVSLGDIAMYTTSEDKPLGEILDLVYSHFNGKPVDIKVLAEKGNLKDEFSKILADYDEERVYEKDIKKLFTWFNILLDAGFTTFTENNADVKEGEGDKEQDKVADVDKKVQEDEGSSDKSVDKKTSKKSRKVEENDAEKPKEKKTVKKETKKTEKKDDKKEEKKDEKKVVKKEVKKSAKKDSE